VWFDEEAITTGFGEKPDAKKPELTPKEEKEARKIAAAAARRNDMYEGTPPFDLCFLTNSSNPPLPSQTSRKTSQRTGG
jgi:hypothetical protein